MRACPAILWFSLSAILPATAVAQTILWSDNNAQRIQQKKVQGGPVETNGPLSAVAGGQIEYDPVSAKLYWRGTAFKRASLDGSDAETIPTPTVGRFTLNVDSRKLYWIPSPSFDALSYSQLDGSAASSHTYPSGTLKTVEAFGDDVFFGAGGDMKKGIWRADADGANEQYLHASGEPTDLAYDPVENKVYLASTGFYGISRMNLDGSDFEVVVLLPQWDLGNSYPEVLAVDVSNRKLYWGDAFARVIQRSNLDGSNVEDFVTASDVGNPNFTIRGLTIVYSSRPVPAVSAWALWAMAGTVLGAGMLILRNRRRAGVVGLDDSVGREAQNGVQEDAVSIRVRTFGSHCGARRLRGGGKPEVVLMPWLRPTVASSLTGARTASWPIPPAAGCATSATKPFPETSRPITRCGRRTCIASRTIALSRSG